MAKVIFINKGIETIIQNDVQDKMSNIFKNYETKIGTNLSNLFFTYNGSTIDESLCFNQIINKEDEEINTIRILVNEKVSTTNDKNIIESKEIICPICNEELLIKLKDYKIDLFDCKNKHSIYNLPLNKNMLNVDLTKIICNNCKSKNKYNTYNNEFYRCFTCKINICPLCKSIHDKNHKIIKYDNKNYYCDKHYMNFIKYCKECKMDMCIKCVQEHNNHDNIDLGEILINETDIITNKNELKENINKLNNNIEEIINKLNNLKVYFNTYYDIYNIIINRYNSENINYEILQNIIEFKNFNKIIIQDINNIINSNNIKDKLNNIIKIYDKIYINDYNLSNEVEKELKNLTYKLDITNTNEDLGTSDIFEAFISYKDNKGYIISPNINNYNLDIFILLSNKSEKVKSLVGHTYHITMVRYFINDENHNEYLISADSHHMVIVWNFTDNGNIKYKINTDYSLCQIHSCLLVFPKNSNDNYIITSTENTSDKSGTKVYSLNNGKFIKYINNTNYYAVFYLLLWHNKKNNKYYIVQFADKNIIINNLLEDELYSKLISESESQHHSGFIYIKENNDYLCSSSINGNINIWDLYNKSMYKNIKIGKDELYHIIKWNDKYIIVADYHSSSYKIINLENQNILDINGQHTKGVICIKKIYHPLYGQSLLSAGSDRTIKLWI